MRPCFLTGAALHTSLAADLAGHLDAVATLPGEPQTVSVAVGAELRQLPYRLLAGVPLDQSGTRLHGVAGALVERALQAAGLDASQRRHCGLFLGSSSFDIGDTEALYALALREDPLALAMAGSSSVGTLADDLRRHFGLLGACVSFSTACTGSANALLCADAMVRHGRLEHALVLGLETFNQVTALGFQGLQLLGTARMRPFSADSAGLLLGEGCSAVVLGNRPRGPHAWRLAGSANHCDTFGISTANPDGSTVAAAMQEALAAAGLRATDIVAIKAHGTATPAGDTAEAAGMRRVFAQAPPVTALKPYLGHTLGACGLNELLLYCAAADSGFLIPTPGIGADDAYPGIRLVQSAQPLPRGHHMLNYFGFGGNNASLILSNLGTEPA